MSKPVEINHNIGHAASPSAHVGGHQAHDADTATIEVVFGDEGVQDVTGVLRHTDGTEVPFTVARLDLLGHAE